MVLVWGLNYSLMKYAFRFVPPMAFNALRFTIASVVFLGVIAVTRQRVGAAGVPKVSLKDVDDNLLWSKKLEPSKA